MGIMTVGRMVINSRTKPHLPVRDYKIHFWRSFWTWRKMIDGEKLKLLSHSRKCIKSVYYFSRVWKFDSS